MYYYPDHLKNKPMLWLWQLRDVALIGMATIISVVMILQFHTILPLVITLTYTILSIRFEATSILDFLIKKWTLCQGH